MNFVYLTISGGDYMFSWQYNKNIENWLKVVQEVRHGASIVLVSICEKCASFDGLW